MIRFLICCIIGHKWDIHRIDEHAATIAEVKQCDRCGLQADWWR